MPEPIHFTKAAVEAILPGARRARYRDARQPGLVLVVEPGGARTWYLYKRHAGTLHETRIGPFPQFAVDQARQKVAEMLAALARDEDPREVAGRARGRDRTFGEVWAWWLEHHAPRLRHWEEDNGVYRRHIERPLGNRQLRLITKAELRELHASLGRDAGQRTANRVIALVRSAWNRALDHDLTKLANPAQAVDLFTLPSRDRRLTAEEAPRFFAALDRADPILRDFVYLLLFTGARKSNVLAMRWDELDLAARTWRIPRTKPGRAQTIPLEDAEVALLVERRAAAAGSPWVFPAHNIRRETTTHMVTPTKRWAALLAEAGIEDLHVHDLRRSLGSWMVDTGASLPVIGSTLGHSSPSATAIYARMSLDPVRVAKRRAIAAMQGG